MLDAVTIEILWRRTISAVDEAAKVHASARRFRPGRTKSNDFACVLTDATGQSLAQNTGSIPSFIGTLPVTVKAVHQARSGSTADGGCGTAMSRSPTTPWIATGHLNDVMRRQADIPQRPDRGLRRLHRACARHRRQGALGGAARGVRGGLPHPRDEAACARAKPDATLIKLLRAAVRTPDQTEGDMWAQITGARLAGAPGRRADERVRQLDDLGAFAEEILRAASGRCGLRSPRCPTAPTATFQTDGLEKPFRFELALTMARRRSPSTMRAPAPQSRRAINCTLTYTFAMTAYALKCALLPNLPNNEGMFRCIEVAAPEGSIVNPTLLRRRSAGAWRAGITFRCWYSAPCTRLHRSG